MRIETIDVGDGACAVVSDTYETTDLTMIDCGRWRNGDRAAANRAMDYLGDRLGDITTFVVTHFDRDHWGGLLKLAPVHAALRPKDLPFIEIRIPGMPEEFATGLRAGILGLVSIRDSVPVNATELYDRWQATGIEVRQTVHYAGDSFEANGHKWNVLWPPHEIPNEMGTQITSWLQDLRALAHEMAEAHYPNLLDNLRKAYSACEELDRASPPKETVREPSIWPSMPDAEPEWLEDTGSSRLETIEPSPNDSEFSAVPIAFKKRLKKLSEQMSALDNALSLVVETEDGGFIGFGDIEGKALEALGARQILRPSYPVMFAPHHGTHLTPDWFPKASVCISQNGTDHHRNNHLHRKTHHNGFSCVSTWDRGNIDVDMNLLGDKLFWCLHWRE